MHTPVKRAIGPLDKRKKATRCQACAERHIKCQDSYPCKYCVRTNKICRPQKPPPNVAKFITVTGDARSGQTTQLAAQVCKPKDALYLDCFALFMHRCQFTKGFASATPDLVSLMQGGCSSLRDVAMAIGALDASRRSSVSSLHGQDSPGYTALNLYGKSIRALRTQLSTTTASLYCEDVLWSTFLIGLFELMSETLGDRWAQHMRHGTSRMLQLAGPTASLSPLHNTFFDTFRVMEATRAIMYGDGTFLSQDAWLYHHPNPVSEGRSVSDPLRSILTLVLQTSSFSKLFFEVLERIPEPERSADPAIDALARQGIHLQHTIRCWYENNASQLDCSDPYAQLAVANYHALQLFHCKNYTFASCWNDKAVPCLKRSEIDGHVASILYSSDQVLESTIIPGILLLFPLRMAGANTLKAEQRTRTAGILDQIYRSGFIVSERIKVDVQELWEFLETPEAS